MPLLKAYVPLLALLLLAAACAAQPQVATPSDAEPMDTPEVSKLAAVCNADQSHDDMETVLSSLGYVISPSYSPEGFDYSSSSVDRRGRANLVYRKESGIMLIAYPVTFQSQGSPTMIELGLIQPADAVSEVSIAGHVGHLLQGRWS